MIVLSYIVTIITLVGTVANSFQKRWCFYIWIPTNLFWVIYNIVVRQYQQSAIYVANLVTSIIGLIKWGNKKRTDEIIQNLRSCAERFEVHGRKTNTKG